MSNELFSNLVPTRILHVTVGKGTGTGTVTDPFHSIQAAVNAATPGTAIVVHAGVYKENVKISHKNSGTASAPIWLISGDGAQEAVIKAADTGKPVIQALGVDNYVVQGFELRDGYDGVQFSQSGRDFSNLVNNVLIKGNVITNMGHDGIKVGQANNVQILDNTISQVKSEEGIDLVAVKDVLVARNEISDVKGSSAAIVAKGGSANVMIIGNDIHDVAGDGISAGGNTGASSFRPGTLGYEAKNVDIVGNSIDDVGKRPVSVRGAQDVDVIDNFLESSSRYGNAVYITSGSQGAGKTTAANDVLVRDNIVAATKAVLKIDAGNNNKVVQSGNAAGNWSDDVGPDGVTPPGWLRSASHSDGPTVREILRGWAHDDLSVGSDEEGSALSDDADLGTIGLLDQPDTLDLSALAPQDATDGLVFSGELLAPGQDMDFGAPLDLLGQLALSGPVASDYPM